MQNQLTINIHIKDVSQRTLEADSDEILRGFYTLHLLHILWIHGVNSVEETAFQSMMTRASFVNLSWLVLYRYRRFITCLAFS